MLSVVAVAALAAAGLSACRSNVGVAAVIDGHRVTESDVADYLTADAKPVQLNAQQGAPQSVAPRVYVLNTLIDDQLFAKLLAATPSGMPGAADIAQVTQQSLQGHGVAEVATQNGLGGFTSEFQQRWVRVQVLGQIINSEVQQGLDVRAIVAKLHFPVRVNPRYGEWSAANFQLSTAPDAGLPDFLAPRSSDTPAPSATPAA
jgi:hypothetical protein